MKLLNILIIIILIVATKVSYAKSIKAYVLITANNNIITNVPEPYAPSHAVNKFYADRFYTTNVLKAIPAKCGGGIGTFSPAQGEDLYSNMRWGVDWQTNTRFYIDATGSNVYDNLTGLIWQKYLNNSTRNWEDCITYCANLVYGGFSDWRMPSRKEIFSLVDFSQVNNCLPNGNPFVNVKHSSSYYWTSSTYCGSTFSKWRIAFNYGELTYSPETLVNYVWAVRAGRK